MARWILKKANLFNHSLVPHGVLGRLYYKTEPPEDCDDECSKADPIPIFPNADYYGTGDEYSKQHLEEDFHIILPRASGGSGLIQPSQCFTLIRAPSPAQVVPLANLCPRSHHHTSVCGEFKHGRETVMKARFPTVLRTMVSWRPAPAMSITHEWSSTLSQ